MTQAQQVDRRRATGPGRERDTRAVMQARYRLTEAGHEVLRRAELAAVQSVLDRAHGTPAGGHR